jgi:N-glycosylase/DNA lyase
LATERVLADVPFFETPLSANDVGRLVFDALKNPLVGYRFPRSRAQQIAASWFCYSQLLGEYHKYIESFETEREARAEVIKKFPGLGPKQASMFLRDIGYARHLAIIDRHILWYLEGRYGVGTSGSWTGLKQYEDYEAILQEEAESHDVELGVYDRALWCAARQIRGHPNYV